MYVGPIAKNIYSHAVLDLRTRVRTAVVRNIETTFFHASFHFAAKLVRFGTCFNLARFNINAAPWTATMA